MSIFSNVFHIYIYGFYFYVCIWSLFFFLNHYDCCWICCCCYSSCVSFSLNFLISTIIFYYVLYVSRNEEGGRYRGSLFRYIYIHILYLYLLFTMRRNCKLCNSVLKLWTTTTTSENFDWKKKKKQMQLCYYFHWSVRVPFFVVFVFIRLPSERANTLT